jgi:hypothetical protein
MTPTGVVAASEAGKPHDSVGIHKTYLRYHHPAHLKCHAEVYAGNLILRTVEACIDPRTNQVNPRVDLALLFVPAKSTPAVLYRVPTIRWGQFCPSRAR